MKTLGLVVGSLDLDCEQLCSSTESLINQQVQGPAPWRACYMRKHHFSFSTSSSEVWIWVYLGITHGSISSKSARNLGASCFYCLHWTLYLRSRISDPRASGENRDSSEPHHHHWKQNNGAFGHFAKRPLIQSGRIVKNKTTFILLLTVQSFAKRSDKVHLRS